MPDSGHIQLDQHGETPLNNLATPFGVIRYLYSRSADSVAQETSGQDYLAFRYDEERVTFALCDGVGQSFMGELAARFLGERLVDWLWKYEGPSDPVAFGAAVRMFLNHLQSHGFGDGTGLGPRVGQPFNVFVQHADGPADSFCHLFIFFSQSTQDTVCFDVLEFNCGRITKRSHGTDLIDKEVLQLLGRDIHFPSPESQKIRQSRVGSDADIVFLCKGNGFSHHVGITAVKSTANIGRADQFDDFLIQAEFITSKTLPHIAVYIKGLDFHEFPLPSMRWQPNHVFVAYAL